MATLTGNIDQTAQIAAKAAFDAEHAACLAAGMDPAEAVLWAQDAGSDAYDAALIKEAV